MNIGYRIKQCRKASKMTLEELARKVGLSRQTLSRYETGVITNIPMDKIQAISTALSISPAYLMGWDDDADPDYPSYPGVLPLPKTRTLPILGAIACGSPILAEENIEGYAAVPNHIQADFCLRCVGDSMIGARICDGDIVYISTHFDFHNGEIYAVLIDDSATLKRVYNIGDSLLELRAENPSVPTLHFEGEQLATVKIIGKAVAFTSNVR